MALSNYFDKFAPYIINKDITNKGEQPKIVETSFETIVVKKQDLTIPVKFSSRLKGKTDVTVFFRKRV